MMKGLRRHTRTVLWIVVGAFVSTIFFVWGMDLGRRGEALAQTSAAMVDGQPISYETFGHAWELRMQQIAQGASGELSPAETRHLRLSLIETLIDQALLQRQFEKSGLKVYPDEVAARIANQPAFQNQGVFSREKYLAVLNYYRISPETFEAEEFQTLAVLKISRLIQDSVVVSEPELQADFRAHTRKIKLRMAVLGWKKELKKIQVSPEEVQAYFSENSAKYQVPEQVRASHILITVKPQATEADKLAARLKLQTLKQEIQQGGDFAALAKKHSEDPGSKDNGGDLGYFQKSAMVPEFAKAAFGLKPGQLSDPVETQFGFHLIKVTGRQAEKKPTLDEKRREIYALLEKAAAQKRARQLALEINAALAASPQLEAASRVAGTAITSTSWVDRSSILPGLDAAASEKVVLQALALPLKQAAGPVETENDFVFVEVAAEQFTPLDTQAYARERDVWLEKLKNRREQQAMKDWLTTARQTAKIVNNIAKEAPEEVDAK